MQQVPDRHLDFARVILTKACQNDPSFLVQKVKPRPGVVAPVVPGPIIVVLGYRKGNALLTNISLHIRTFVLEAELRRVDADDLETMRAILGLPAFQIDHGSAAVDAGVSPEVDQHDLAAQ